MLGDVCEEQKFNVDVNSFGFEAMVLPILRLILSLVWRAWNGVSTKQFEGSNPHLLDTVNKRHRENSCSEITAAF
jgi:hypothetical protein